MRSMLMLTLLAFAPLNGATQQEATELETRLTAHVVQYNLRAKDLGDAVARISKQFQLPAGIEWVKDEEARRELNLAWEDTTVQDILTSVLEQYPGYAFRAENGVAHVFRKDLVDDGTDFLNLNVPDWFEVRQEAGGFANVRLRAVIQNIVSPRNLPPGAGEGGSYTSGNVSEKPLTLTLQGPTVREALERLADASEHKMWFVTFSDSHTLTPTGFLRTETIWHLTPWPDSDQPMWDFLAWQQYLPPSPTTPPAPK